MPSYFCKMGPRTDLSPANPDFINRIHEKREKNSFSQYLGIVLTTINAGYVEAEMMVKPEHLQQNRFFHGGLLATMADVVMGFAAFTLLDKEHSVVTADLQVSFLLPGSGATLRARGWVEKPGNQLHFCAAELFCQMADSAEWTRIVLARSSMAVIAKP